MPDMTPVRQIARAVLGNLPDIRCGEHEQNDQRADIYHGSLRLARREQ
jgi:hypothetical protein